MDAPAITLVQKAANVCAYCRVRKQACDRVLPSCSRCARKQRPCDYTLAPELRHLASHESDSFLPLYASVGCVGPDLSSRGRSELLQAVSDCTNQSPGSVTRFSEIVHEILEQANVTIAGLLQEYVSSMHRWIPLISPDQLLHDGSQPGGMLGPLLLLSMFLVTRRPGGGCTADAKSGILYTTLKQIHALLHVSGEVHLELMQANILVSIYECAHGLARQAYVTLSACVAQSNLLDLRNRRFPDVATSEETLIPQHVSILVLDRVIALSSVDTTIPPVCPSTHPLSQRTSRYLDTHTIGPYQTNPILKAERKLKVQAQVALATGRALEYVYAVKRGEKPPEKYDDVEQDLAAVVRSLVEKQESHSWLMCDCVAMGFSTLLVLHQTGIQQPDIDPKAGIALHFSRRMAWDMNILLIDKLDREPEISHLPFGGLACVVRAAVAVAETSYDKSIPREEIATILPVLGRFEDRWKVGGQ